MIWVMARDRQTSVFSGFNKIYPFHFEMNEILRELLNHDYIMVSRAQIIYVIRDHDHAPAPSDQ